MPSMGSGGSYGGDDVSGGFSGGSGFGGSDSGNDTGSDLSSIADQALADAGITQSGGMIGGDTGDNGNWADDAINWAASISGDPQSQNLLQSILGVKTTPAYNPLTNRWEDKYTKTVSPIAIAAGLVNPALGLLAAKIDDPLAIDLDLGFFDGTTQSDKTGGHVSTSADFETDKKSKDKQTTQQVSTVNEEDKPEFGDQVAQFLEETNFQFGEMPDFKLLSNLFGKDFGKAFESNEE